MRWQRLIGNRVEREEYLRGFLFWLNIVESRHRSVAALGRRNVIPLGECQPGIAAVPSG